MSFPSFIGLYSALPRVLVGAAVLGGTGFLLTAGSARAACFDVVSFSDWSTGTALTCDDTQFIFTSSSDITDPGLLTVTAIGFGNNYALNLSFGTLDPISTFTLNYDAIITDPNFFFEAVALDTGVSSFAPNEVLTATFTGFSPSVVLTSTNGTPDSSPGAGAPTILNVANVYNSNGGTIASLTTSFQVEVPAPLPILGAGFAFGFSRKLRSRIKTRNQA
jgi:hypothetical protein